MKDGNFGDFVHKTQHAPQSHVDGTSWFKRLKLDVISRELDLETFGAERGARNEPPRETTDFDEIEERILDYVRDRQSESEQEFITQRETYWQRLSKNGLLSLVSEIDTAAKVGATKIETAAAEAAGALPHLAIAAEKARAEYVQFKERNLLKREGRYPTPGRLFLQVAFVAAFLLGETAANGFFFAKGSELGLIGGWSEAFMFAAANILVALVGGMTIGREAGHTDKKRKILGVGLTATWLAGTILFATFVGHYRDALEVGAANTYAVASSKIVDSGINFESAHSWILFIAGLCFALLSFADGRALDDPFPGYGKVTKAKDQAAQDYEDRRIEYLERVQEAYEEAVSDMGRKAKDSHKRLAESERIVVDLKTLGTSYTQHLKYLESVGNNLLQVYREANKRTRSEAMPASFRKKWKEFVAPALDLTPAEYSRASLDRIIADAEKKRDMGTTRLDKKRATAVASLKPLSVEA